MFGSVYVEYVIGNCGSCYEWFVEVMYGDFFVVWFGGKDVE